MNEVTAPARTGTGGNPFPSLRLTLRSNCWSTKFAEKKTAKFQICHPSSSQDGVQVLLVSHSANHKTNRSSISDAQAGLRERGYTNGEIAEGATGTEAGKGSQTTSPP